MARRDPRTLDLSGGNLRRFLRGVPWAIRLIWTTSRAIFWGLVVSVALLSVLPAAQALAGRNLVNALVAAAGGSEGPARVLTWLAVSMGLVVVAVVIRYLHEYLSAVLLDDLCFEIPGRILEHAAALDFAFFEDPRSQDLLERARDSIAPHIHRFLTSVLDGLTGALQAALLLVVLAGVEPLLLPVLLVLVVPYLVVSGRVAGRRFSVEHTRATKRRWTAYFVACLTGRDWVGEVRLFDLAPLFTARFRELMGEFRSQDRKTHRHRLLARSCFGALAAAAFCVLLVRVAYRVASGRLTVGDFTLFLGATHRLLHVSESAITAAGAAYEQALFVSDLDEFLSIRPRIEVVGGAALEKRVAAGIECRHVTFTYPGQETPTLDDISLEIRPGETVALVGPNGAGKTTLVKLIARFYDPDRGAILMDGVDLREISHSELHRHIAVSMQTPHPYEATAGENLAYGDWKRLLGDPAAIEEAARRTGVHDLIQGLPEGYETFLGRRFGDHDLSGGEWTRLAVARALARESSLVILDEPTAHLDARTEHDLFCRFGEACRGRTAIVISHRFSTVGMADRILVLDGGRLIEEGSHEELLERGGPYASLFRLHLARAIGR